MSDEPRFVDGHLEPSVEFDFDAVEPDRGNPLTAALEASCEMNRLTTLVAKYQRVVTEIYSAHNSKKAALCFLIATGDAAAQGKKITAAAKDFGVSKGDISQCCVDWCKFMGLEPSSYMRSQASKESFKKSNNRKRKQ